MSFEICPFWKFTFFKKKKNTFIYLFIFGYAGSSLLTVLCLAVESGNYSPVAVGGLLIAAVSLIVEHGL